MSFSERAIKKSQRREEEPPDVGGSPTKANDGNAKSFSFRDAVLNSSPVSQSDYDDWVWRIWNLQMVMSGKN